MYMNWMTGWPISCVMYIRPTRYVTCLTCSSDVCYRYGVSDDDIVLQSSILYTDTDLSFSLRDRVGSIGKSNYCLY